MAPFSDSRYSGRNQDTMASKFAPHGLELEPIDRLEEKLKLLVGVIDRLKAEQSQLVEENRRLTRELDSARSRIAQSDAAASEVTSLKEERDVIRQRVGEMLEQLEALNL